MKRRCRSILCLFIIPVFIYSHIPAAPGIKLYVSHFENVLGTSFELKIAAESEALADNAEVMALAEIDRLAGILSAYDAESEFSRWNKSAGQPVKISDELFTVLSLFDQWRINTGGALDASAEAVSRVWGNAARNKQIPSQQDINQALKLVKEQQWILDKMNHTAMRTGSSPLMMNSFVKSYIIRKVAEKITALQGIHGAMVNIGGDIVIIGDIQENIRISDPKADAENDIPLAIINVHNRAIATSGNYRRGFNIGGKWYSHIVDPRTGIPADSVISATVVSPNATDAGAMATAFNVLEITESRKLAATIPGTEYLIITRNGERYSSEGWYKLEVANALPAITTKSRQADYELLINLELAQFEGRFRRPFVAIWVQDANKKTVRNLALWFNKPRWLPDLKEWYRTNYQEMAASGKDVESISSATRPPGKYTLKWDLKDDMGNLVPAGKYTVYIESAREHGTYQLIKKEIECKKKEQIINLPGNTEISSSSLEYHKVSANQ